MLQVGSPAPSFVPLRILRQAIQLSYAPLQAVECLKSWSREEAIFSAEMMEDLKIRAQEIMQLYGLPAAEGEASGNGCIVMYLYLVVPPETMMISGLYLLYTN